MQDPWRFTATYLPDRAVHNNHHAMRAAREAFAEYLCNLPVCRIKFQMKGRGKNQLTPSKLYTLWALEGVYALRCTEASSYGIDSLDGWVFMPPRSSRCQDSDKWQPTDMLQHCRQGSRSSSSSTVSAAAAAARSMQGAPPPVLANAITPETWWLGQLTRIALDSIGPCLRQARDGHLARVHTIGMSGARKPFTIAMHVRRGDACQRWAHEQPATGTATTADLGGEPLRACYDLRAYMEEARKLKARYNATHVHIRVATDSQSVVQQIHEYRGEFSFSFLHLNRTAIGGVEGHNMHKRRNDALFIEERASRLDAARKKLLLSTLLADVAHLAGAEAFVGDHLSIITRLVIFAIVGRIGRVPPFALLGGSLEVGVWGKAKWPPC